MCLTLQKRASRGGYDHVGASGIVTPKLQQKHPSEEEGEKCKKTDENVLCGLGAKPWELATG